MIPPLVEKLQFSILKEHCDLNSGIFRIANATFRDFRFLIIDFEVTVEAYLTFIYTLY